MSKAFTNWFSTADYRRHGVDTSAHDWPQAHRQRPLQTHDYHHQSIHATAADNSWSDSYHPMISSGGSGSSGRRRQYSSLSSSASSGGGASGWSTPSTAAISSSGNEVYADFVLTKRDVQTFRRLLDEPAVQELLLWDKCCLLADKYLLAMALTYFKRAGLRHQQYTPVYLMVALYLAHDMEEDDLDVKLDLVRFAMSDTVSDSKLRLFLRKRDKLWHQMGLRAAVNHHCCDAIMRYCMPDHPVWQREREVSHGGVCVPAHVKYVVHRELGLCNSYVECNVQCIVCLSHIVMRRRQKVVVMADESGGVAEGRRLWANHLPQCPSTGKPFFSTLSAHSAPFVPQNLYPLGVSASEE
ncbi:unnamed protein product [Oppiella nova]|uniref:Uncharacterized protein n=1 Tax=Oppiella nova TaxID=334625 RepID=A0A7R9MB55_9ACAR|nr:unnamed protein product [Oppiella nova]CAG2172857.1 unnamed protein product [Oppiella nova]